MGGNGLSTCIVLAVSVSSGDLVVIVVMVCVTSDSIYFDFDVGDVRASRRVVT